jgi:hypothetical protein
VFIDRRYLAIEDAKPKGKIHRRSKKLAAEAATAKYREPTDGAIRQPIWLLFVKSKSLRFLVTPGSGSSLFA